MVRSQLLCGDVATVLKTLPAQSVHCVVTSPPYFRLRDYGIAGQIGLERTGEEYIERIVAAFRQVRRVLRRDGTLWLNMGDGYIGSWRGGDPKKRGDRDQKERLAELAVKKGSVFGLREKQLIMMPVRVALALQADGWWIRQDNIWSKRNVMPESCRDRTTRAHEYLFHLTRSAHYYYDSFAIEEPQNEQERTRRLREQKGQLSNRVFTLKRDYPGYSQTSPGRSGSVKSAKARQLLALKGTRNKRSVWSIGTQPFKEAHFATFPEKLVEPCILAGTSERGCCSLCGAPIERQVMPTREYAALLDRNLGKNHLHNRLEDLQLGREGNGIAAHGNVGRGYQTMGWKAGCSCSLGRPVPCTVLDPFMGAGTTGIVALRAGRNFIGIDLSPEYVAMAKKRIKRET
jgi:DNA modification methylase